MAANNTLDTLNGLFKNVYADQLEDLIPDGVKLLAKIPFSKRESIGLAYNQPVVLGMEHGVTFAGPTEDAFTLNDAVAGQIKNAEVKSSQLLLRSVLGYASASRSAEGGAKAFKSATKFLVGNMLRSVTKKLEIELLYGQVGYATVGAALSASTITIPTAEWAPGIWAGAENMPIDVRASDGTNSRLRTVTAVNFETRTITVDSAIVLDANDVIWHKGAYGKEFAGIHKIITNTGTLFGIDAASYSLWKGNTYSAGSAALSFEKLQEAVAKAVEKGLDSDVTVVVNPEVWAQLLTDQAALRMYDSSFSTSKMESGSKEIKFHGQNGMIEIIPSIYCKRGFAYVLSMDEMMRIGSTEVTFRRPGKGDEFFRDVENLAGYELRCYTDQCVFSHAPGKNVLINNIA
jgi:hypothetical protein